MGWDNWVMIFDPMGRRMIILGIYIIHGDRMGLNGDRMGWDEMR